MNAIESAVPIRIAGGGLAGLALGIALQRRGVAVQVHEALTYPRHRVCGEFISGVSEKTIESLGIGGIMEQCLRHRQATWWSGETMLSAFTLPQAAYACSRYRMDQQLCDLLTSLGGQVVESSRLPSVSPAGVVWAAGRCPTKGPWLGLKMHIKGVPLHTELEMHLGDHGYVGMSQVEDGWVNVCGLFRLRADAKARHEDLLFDYLKRCGLSFLAKRLERGAIRDGSFSAVAGFQLGRQAIPMDRVAVGDAESIIPPFTGNGMSMALQSAEAAVEPLMDYAAGRTSWSDCATELRQRQHRLFRRRLLVAQWFHRALIVPQWRRSIEILAVPQLLPLRLLFALTR